MTDRSNADNHFEGVAGLLLGYLAGTLTTEQQKQVEEYLANHPEASKELEEIRMLRQEYQQLHHQQADPSTQVFERLKARIAKEVGREQPAPVPFEPAPEKTSSGSSAEGWIHRVFGLQWVPAAAVLIIVAQGSWIIWSEGVFRESPTTKSEISPRPVIERSVPQAILPKRSNRIRIIFQESITEREIRQIIQQISGRMTDGPSADGAYIIEVDTRDPHVVKELDGLISVLGKEKDRVRSIERIHP